MDTLVRFGRAAALRQQDFGGPKALQQGDFPWLIVSSIAIALSLAALGASLLWRRRLISGSGRMLDRAIAAARVNGAPLELVGDHCLVWTLGTGP